MRAASACSASHGLALGLVPSPRQPHRAMPVFPPMLRCPPAGMERNDGPGRLGPRTAHCPAAPPFHLFWRGSGRRGTAHRLASLPPHSRHDPQNAARRPKPPPPPHPTPPHPACPAGTTTSIPWTLTAWCSRPPSPPWSSRSSTACCTRCCPWCAGPPAIPRAACCLPCTLRLASLPRPGPAGAATKAPGNGR